MMPFAKLCLKQVVPCGNTLDHNAFLPQEHTRLSMEEKRRPGSNIFTKSFPQMFGLFNMEEIWNQMLETSTGKSLASLFTNQEFLYHHDKTSCVPLVMDLLKLMMG